MDGISNTMRIAMAEAEPKLKPDQPIEERLRTAMSATKDHWLVTSEDEQFRCAIGAVMLSYGSSAEEFKRLEWCMKQINTFSAYLIAAQQGLDVNFPEDPDEGKYEPLPLMDMWRETGR